MGAGSILKEVFEKNNHKNNMVKSLFLPAKDHVLLIIQLNIEVFVSQFTLYKQNLD